MDSLDLFHRLHGQVHAAAALGPYDANDVSYADLLLSGVSDGQMRSRPTAGINSLAWLLWHVTRAEDAAISILSGAPQVLDDGWPGRLHVSRRDIGTGMSSVEVSELSDEVDLGELHAYRAAVSTRTRAAVAQIALAAWDEGIDAELRAAAEHGIFSPAVAQPMEAFWVGKPRKWFLWQPTGHAFYHLGEMACVRSLLGLPGFG